MPIQFSQPTPQGVTVNYNVVNSLNYDPLSNTTAVQLQSYINQAAYAAGSQPFPGQGFTFSGQQTVDTAEQLIISLPAWNGSTIVS